MRERALADGVAPEAHTQCRAGREDWATAAVGPARCEPWEASHGSNGVTRDQRTPSSDKASATQPRMRCTSGKTASSEPSCAGLTCAAKKYTSPEPSYPISFTCSKGTQLLPSSEERVTCTWRLPCAAGLERVKRSSCPSNETSESLPSYSQTPGITCIMSLDALLRRSTQPGW